MEKNTRTILIVLGLIGTIALVALLLLGYEKKYTVTFNSNGGTMIESQEIKKGGYVIRPTNPIREGYEFVEWQYNNVIFDFNTQITNDMILVATWKEEIPQEENYIVTFQNGSEIKRYKVIKNQTVKTPTEPKKEGYKFLGWYLNEMQFDFNTPITGNITLIAKFVEEKTKTFNVSFNTDGGDNIKSQIITEGEKAKQPSNPTKKGYKFLGWYLNNAKYNFNDSVTEDLTLTAKWEEVGIVKIEFDTTGGSNIKTQEITKGSIATNPTNPTRTGYTFVEWQLNGSTYNFNTSVTGNITLTAKWTKDPVKYTVTFNSDGGSSVASQTITEGGKATKPTNPTRTGYTFVEWQLNGSTYNFNTSITRNITLTAKWNKNVTYTIKKTKVDNFSLDVILSVYADGQKIGFKNIKYNGVTICTSSNPAVNTDEIASITAFTVTLLDGQTVTATVE